MSVLSEMVSHRTESFIMVAEQDRFANGTSFQTLLDYDGGRSHQNDATAVHEGCGRFCQASFWFASCIDPEQTASSKRVCSTQAGSTSSTLGRRRRESVWSHDCRKAQVASRVLEMHGEIGVQCSGIRWRSGATIAEADDGSSESINADLQRLEEDDRAASVLLDDADFLQGADLDIVFLAGDCEGLEAWRQLTEQYELRMITRFVRKLMPILSHFKATRPNAT